MTVVGTFIMGIEHISHLFPDMLNVYKCYFFFNFFWVWDLKKEIEGRGACAADGGCICEGLDGDTGSVFFLEGCEEVGVGPVAEAECCGFGAESEAGSVI